MQITVIRETQRARLTLRDPKERCSVTSVGTKRIGRLSDHWGGEGLEGKIRVRGGIRSLGCRVRVRVRGMGGEVSKGGGRLIRYT